MLLLNSGDHKINQQYFSWHSFNYVWGKTSKCLNRFLREKGGSQVHRVGGGRSASLFSRWSEQLDSVDVDCDRQLESFPPQARRLCEESHSVWTSSLEPRRTSDLCPPAGFHFSICRTDLSIDGRLSGPPKSLFFREVSIVYSVKSECFW